MTASKTLAPENLAARIWLAQLYVVSRMPGEALKLVEQIRSQPDLLDAARTNRTELLFVETSAHLAQGDLGRRGGRAGDACGSILATRICWPPRRRCI